MMAAKVRIFTTGSTEEHREVLVLLYSSRAGIVKSESVSAIMQVVLAVFFFPHRDHTPVRRLAHDMFQLDGRMVDAKSLAEFFVDLAQNGIALRSCHVRDLDMRREGVVFRPNAPTMEIMHVAHAC